MKYFIILYIFLTSSLLAQDLKIKAKTFTADEKTGISIFKGDVNVINKNDELNSTKLTVYTDKNNQPTKFIAEGDAKFKVVTLDGSLYRGKAQKIVYYPNKKEYQFFNKVHLKQINEKKEIIGEEVVLNTIEGKAYAKGDKSEPVIMIFKMPDDKKKDIK